MKKGYLLYAVAALIGVAIWVAIVEISGKREAWDSDIYFSVGMTVACVASFVLGLIEPERPWRWGALPFAIPAILTARLGAFVATNRRASS